MSTVVGGLLAQLLLAAAAVALAVAAPARRRNLLAGTGSAALAAAGAGTGAFALTGASGALRIPTALPLPELVFAQGRLGGLFMLVAGCVGILAALYGIGYCHGVTASRTQWTALPAFLLGMQLVPAASDVVSFLLAWELMAGASTVLVLADHTRPQTRRAALWYAVMTHLSLALILAGFAVLAAHTGGTGFAVLAHADRTSAAASVAFCLLVLGFASKAGLVPLHVWLPRAHPEAPSHASALMSAAMVAMGVYGALLVTVRLMPGGRPWWGIVLMALGGLSAVYGILQAAVASDVKRLLAYSTTENVGLMFLTLGLSMLLRYYGVPGPAGVALVACLLLVVSHAAFKATLFLGAGAVLHATSERDLDRLGGLVHAMPWTAAAFGIGALGAASLPLTVGFVAEWTLFQALIHAAQPGDRLVAVLVPLALAVIALTAGLALLTFTKAYGIAFLARARSDGARLAHEVPRTMRAALLVGASAVVVLGLVPGPLATLAATAAGVHRVETVGAAGLSLGDVGALLDPLTLTLLAVGVALPVVVTSAALARRHPRRREAPGWGCGAVRTSPRMQYTATSYAEPLMRVFDEALQTTRGVEVESVEESRFLAARVEYRQRVADVVEDRLYRPVLRAADRFGERARGLQNGSIHRYLAFSFGALVAVLLAVAR